MNKLLLGFLIVSTNFCFGQIKNDRYVINEPANLVISSLNFKNQDEIIGKLSSGETVKILKKYLQMKLIIQSNSDYEILKVIDDKVEENDIDQIPFLELYEYDFNADGNKELLVVTSPDAKSFNSLEIYKHNSIYVKKVGNISLGISATFDKNLMSIYSGARDSHINFLFLENRFWKLAWHNPEGKEE